MSDKGEGGVNNLKNGQLDLWTASYYKIKSRFLTNLTKKYYINCQLIIHYYWVCIY